MLSLPRAATPKIPARTRRPWLVLVLALASLALLLGLIWQKADLLSRITALMPEVSTHAKLESKLHGLNVQVLTLQASRRAFLTTGREEHITVFEKAATELNTLRTGLRTLTEGNGEQFDDSLTEHLGHLEDLLPAYMAQLRKSIRLRIEAPDDIAQQNRITDDSLSLSRRIIDELGLIVSTMDRQMHTQVDNLSAAAKQAQTSEGWLSAVALATVALGFGVAGMQMRRRALFQAELEQANQTLEQRVAVRTASLSESEHRYRTLVELSADAVLLVNRTLTVEYANVAARDLMHRLGQPAVTGQSIDVLLGSLLWQPMSKQIETLWLAPAALPYQLAVLHGPKLAEVPVQWTAASHAAPHPDAQAGGEAGVVHYVQIIVHDLTELRKNEAEARERTLFIDQLIEAMPVPVSVRGDQGRFLQVNAAFEAAYQTPREKALQQTTFDLVPEDTAWEITRQDAQAARSMGSVSYEFQQTGAKGHTRDVLAHARAVRRTDGRLQGIVTVETDITALRHKEQELFKANDELVRLSSDLRQTQETERRHIARELHDQVGQTMTALKLSLGQLSRDAGVPRELLQSRLDMIDDALNHTRNLSRALHPHVLEDLGLAAALDWLVEQFVSPAVAKVEQDVAITPSRSEPHNELAAFRVAQEALTNAVRHANARCVRLRAVCKDGFLQLTVSDDGRGFAASDRRGRTPASASSLGLVSMRERMHDVGGELRIDSSPETGTVVSAVIAWPPP
jgi:two-component system, NarL family, sensor histidine kinase UhpB